MWYIYLCDKYFQGKKIDMGGRSKNVVDAIKETEYTLAKYNFVLSNFPDAKIHGTSYTGFSSKSVNSTYTDLEFSKGYRALYVVPHSKIEFVHNGVSEIIKVHSSPARSRLAYVSFERKLARTENPYTIKFSRVKFNLKNHDFKTDMLNDCRVQILQFIKDYPKHKLDDKHLEPRLKKLLLFT